MSTAIDPTTEPDVNKAAANARRSLADLGDLAKQWGDTPPTETTRAELERMHATFAEEIRRATLAEQRIGAYRRSLETTAARVDDLWQETYGARQELGRVVNVTAANLPSADELEGRLGQMRRDAHSGIELATASASSIAAGRELLEQALSEIANALRSLPSVDASRKADEALNLARQTHTALGALQLALRPGGAV